MTDQDQRYRFLRPAPQRADLARRSLLLLAAAAVAVFALLAQLGENGIVSWWRLRGETGRLAAQVRQLEQDNATAGQRLDRLADDPQALEALAREEYGMRRPDEEVLTVLQPETAEAGKAGRVP